MRYRCFILVVAAVKVELSFAPFKRHLFIWASISCDIPHCSSQALCKLTVGTLAGIFNIELAICTVVRNVSGPASSTVGGDISALWWCTRVG